MGLSYKAAWDAVDAMNNLASSALVTRTTGGTRGGSTLLTDYGKHVVELVRKTEQDYANVLAGTVSQLSRGEGQVEVTVLLGAERTLTAVGARAEAPDKLARGSRVRASFSPEHVLLVHLG